MSKNKESTIEEIDTTVAKVNLMLYNDLVEIYGFTKKEQKIINDFIDNYGNLLTYHGDGLNISIEFLHVSIWNTNDDQRELNELNEYEPFDLYIIREIKRIVSILCLLKKLK